MVSLSGFRREKRREKRREEEETSNIFFSLDLPFSFRLCRCSCIAFCRGHAAEEHSVFLFFRRDRDTNDAFEASNGKRKESGPGLASELPSENHGLFFIRTRRKLKHGDDALRPAGTPPFLFSPFSAFVFLTSLSSSAPLTTGTSSPRPPTSRPRGRSPTSRPPSRGRFPRRRATTAATVTLPA